MDTQISICSRALLRIGGSALSSFNDGSIEAEIAQNLYPGVRDTLLSGYPWSFATAQTKLTQLAENPLTEFSYAYQLPIDFIRALSLGIGRKESGVEYRLQGRRLLTDVQEVVLTYIFRPEPSAFPAYFTQVLVEHLSAEFCLPLTESASRGEGLLRAAQKNLQMARNIDAQQQTPKTIDLNNLINARF